MPKASLAPSIYDHLQLETPIYRERSDHASVTTAPVAATGKDKIMTRISPSSIKRFLFAASIAFAIPLTASAFERGEHCGHGMGMGGPQGEMMMPMHLKGLNLSEAQRDKIFEIMHAQAPAMRDKAKALHQAEADLHSFARSAEYNDAKAATLADTAAKALADMQLSRIRTEHQVYELLTPEQRQQLANWKPRRPGPRQGPGPVDAAPPAPPAAAR